jgi:hypothetical protein
LILNAATFAAASPTVFVVVDMRFSPLEAACKHCVLEEWPKSVCVFYYCRTYYKSVPVFIFNKKIKSVPLSDP